MDHPLSFLYQTLNNNAPNYKVSFPPVVTASELAKTKLVQNGFYSRESLTLQGAYKNPYENSLVMPLDERFAFNTRDTFQMGTNVFLKDNLLYEPNTKLLNDINRNTSKAPLNENHARSSMFD